MCSYSLVSLATHLKYFGKSFVVFATRGFIGYVAYSTRQSSHFKYLRLYLLFLLIYFCLTNVPNLVVDKNNPVYYAHDLWGQEFGQGSAEIILLCMVPTRLTWSLVWSWTRQSKKEGLPLTSVNFVGDSWKSGLS